VARTLADLAEQPGEIGDQFVLTALGMRAGIGRSAVGRAA
jgi:hypothetical protein